MHTSHRAAHSHRAQGTVAQLRAAVPLGSREWGRRCPAALPVPPWRAVPGWRSGQTMTFSVITRIAVTYGTIYSTCTRVLYTLQ